MRFRNQIALMFRMKSDGEILAVWLMPASDECERFERLIHELAEQCDAPVFEPHVTLYVTAFDAALPWQALDTVIFSDVVQLEVEGIGFSEEFTRTLFVQFKPNAELNQLSDAIGRALGRASDYRINPHVSLLYRDLPNEKKAELARTVLLGTDVVHFDTFKAIVSPAKISTAEDVASWRTVWERRL